VLGLSERCERLKNFENGGHVSLAGEELDDHKNWSIFGNIFFVRLKTQIVAKDGHVEFFAVVGGAFCVSFAVMVCAFGKVGEVADKVGKGKDPWLVTVWAANPLGVWDTVSI
jgi:hypothetical protein